MYYSTMLSYYLKCKRDTESENQNVSNSSNGKIMHLSKCVVRNSKLSRLIKKQEANALLSQ